MPELLLPRLKREIEARLDELRPIVEEAERLAAAKDALLAEAAAVSTAPPRRPRAALPSHAFRAELRNGAASTPLASNGNGNGRSAASEDDADDRAPRGANQTAILAIVEERPGVSVAEISSVTKIPKPTVATTVSKLKREGVLADEAGGVKLASRQPLTLSQAAASAPQRDVGVSDEEWEAARKSDPAAA
ncbi:MAG TPA: helix-turn-helix domain-containing protein [Conexibacter sp.]|nr:helix-turn-helix domain-containing protein [Conexibacter sp.]